MDRSARLNGGDLGRTAPSTQEHRQPHAAGARRLRACDLELLAISANDPQSIDGYTYFEQLHDGDLGPCEHKNDTFMPWHRAHLFLFEEALRRSDPPRTATVTVPYWDWSALPSGTRYPKAFENQGSVLFHDFRNDTPICRTDRRERLRQPAVPARRTRGRVLSIARWSTPGRRAVASQLRRPRRAASRTARRSSASGSGRSSNPPTTRCMTATSAATWPSPRSRRSIRSSSPSTATSTSSGPSGRSASRPTPTSRRGCAGCSRTASTCPENRFRVKDTLDTKTQLGYVYEYTPGRAGPGAARCRGAAAVPGAPGLRFRRQRPQAAGARAHARRHDPGARLRGCAAAADGGERDDAVLLQRRHLSDARRRGAAPRGPRVPRDAPRGPALLLAGPPRRRPGARTTSRSISAARSRRSPRPTPASSGAYRWRSARATTRPRPHHGDHDHAHGAAAHQAVDLAETMDFGDLTLDLY